MLENQVTQVGVAQMFDTIWSPSFQHVCGAFTQYNIYIQGLKVFYIYQYF